MKFLKAALKFCAFLVVCAIAGIISANLIAKPVFLTNEEIIYYTDTAEIAWYDGLSFIKEYEDIDVECNLDKRQVHIIPFNKNKQSLTVTFYADTQTVTINKPVVSFWGCFFFYGLFFGYFAFVILYLLFLGIKHVIHSYKSKNANRILFNITFKNN